LVPFAPQTIKIVSPIVFGRKSITVDCYNCHQTVNTKTEKHIGALTYSMAAGLATVGCLLGLPCIGLFPLCITECKDVSHTCPKCNIHLGNFSRLRA
ncbi:lipopolysaccharide-induced tumor necrosis factor-alpha factor-like protein, partial [Leptotrombidium deliense]